MAELRRDELGNLHGDRARTPRAPAVQRGQQGSGYTRPVHAVMYEEASVLAGHDRIAQRGCYAVARRPGQPPDREIDAHHVERSPVAIDQPRLACAPFGPNSDEVRHGRWECPQGEHHRRREQHQQGREGVAPRPVDHASNHGFTIIGRLGSAALISGEYIASTRVGGI
jgi:hypothetical protein